MTTTEAAELVVSNHERNVIEHPPRWPDPTEVAIARAYLATRDQLRQLRGLCARLAATSLPDAPDQLDGIRKELESILNQPAKGQGATT